MTDKFPVLRDIRVWFYAVLTGIICYNFWAGSRYPSLSAKADTDPATALQTPLGFTKHFLWQVDSLLGRIGLTTIEWVETNRIGMTFGLLLAAAVISLLPYMPKANPSGRWSIVRGVLFGSPLGVCTNCAAPISASMLRGGSRLETALAVNLSSPSFNIIVLGMLFSLFPWYFATVKIVSAVLLIFVAIPVVVKLAPLRTDPRQIEATNSPTGLMGRISEFLTIKIVDAPPVADNFLSGLVSAVMTYVINLLRVALMVVPLMLLAGLLGAILIELLPWQNFGIQLVDQPRMMALAFLILAALLGTLLPVPIAFDILICVMLLRSGAPDYIVGAMLVTLGIFSIYPMMLYARIWSLRGAVVLTMTVAIAGVAGGLATQYLGKIDGDRQEAILLRSLAQGFDRDLIEIVDDGPRLSSAEIAAQIAPLPDCTSTGFELGVIKSCANQADTFVAGALRYDRHDGGNFGLKPTLRRDLDLFHSLSGSYNGGVAQGDINLDGWPDIAIGTSQGPQLFVNIGGRWVAQDIGVSLDGKGLDGMAGAIALIDLNNDRFPELVFGGVDRGLTIMWNKAGVIGPENATRLLPETHGYASALGFADIDRNGQLDIIVGITSGVRQMSMAYSNTNFLIYNPAGDQRITEIDGYGGETLSMVAHDFDLDGWTDVIFGNDFQWPDMEYKNVEGALVRREGVSDGMRDRTTGTTMSLDVATLEFDDRDVLYSGQISFGDLGEDHKDWTNITKLTGCNAYDDPQMSAHCMRLYDGLEAIIHARNARNLAYCFPLDEADRPYCAAIGGTAVRDGLLFENRYCNEIGHTGMPAFDRFCSVIATTIGRVIDMDAVFAGYGDQSNRDQNMLQRFDGTNWEVIEKAGGAHQGAWTWNAKFVDADADGYQDLILSNGWWLEYKQSDLLFFRGNGIGFTPDETVGLEFDLPTNAHVTVDFDRDGDLDVISAPIHMRPVLFENKQTSGQLVEIGLDSACGNRPAIGAKLIATADGHKMTRWIKASGGYQSSDEPIAQFGIGKAKAIDHLQIAIPGVQPIKIDVPLGPGRHTIQIGSAACQ